MSSTFRCGWLENICMPEPRRAVDQAKETGHCIGVQPCYNSYGNQVIASRKTATLGAMP